MYHGNGERERERERTLKTIEEIGGT